MGFIRYLLDRYFAAATKRFDVPLLGTVMDFDALVLSCIKESKSSGLMNWYTLDFSASRKRGRHEEYPEIYWETKYGFVLCVQDGFLRNTPIASIGFDIRKKHIIVRQLQGVKGMKDCLSPIHWEQLLLRIVVKFARELGMESVHVRSARNSDYHPSESPETLRGLSAEECNARVLRFHLVYDKAPQKCGFKWNEDTRTHMLVL